MRTKKRIVSTLNFVIFMATITLGISSCSANKVESKPTNAANMVAAEVKPTAVYGVSEPLKTVTAVENESAYPITQEEIELIALVTMGEAEGETELGKRLVIDTILNRMDDEHFPDTVYGVIYQPNQFSVMWNGRIDRCCVMPEIVELVKEELLGRTNYDCVFFMAGEYSKYGAPLFRECCHYFSSYD